MKNKAMELFEKYLGMGDAEVILLFLPTCFVVGTIVLSRLCE